MINIDDRFIRNVSPVIKPNALSVLLAIATHINKEDNCFPSHDRLMKLTGLGRDAVYAALSVLKEKGLLKSHQEINSKKKLFGKRTFTIETTLIGFYLPANKAKPLTEKPDTELPHTDEPDTAIPETKVLTTSEVLTSNEVLTKEEEEKPNAISQTTTPSLPETFPLEEKEKKAPPVPVAPPAAAQRYDHQVFPNAQRQEPFSLETGIAEIRANPFMRESFSKARRVPAELFESYLTEFGLEQAAVGATHHNLADFRKHFLNYSAKRYESEQKRQAAAPQKAVHSRVPRF